MVDYNQYLKAIKGTVERAGEEVKTIFHRTQGPDILKYKGEARDDLVTNGDLYVQEIITTYIKKNFPEHIIHSEESDNVQQDSEYRWILDPIDGTKYYARGVPLYSISLALEHRKKLVLGIVYLPETQQMFYAAEGKGSNLITKLKPQNTKTIKCSSLERIEDAMICLEIPSRDYPPEEQKKAFEYTQKLINTVQRVRIIGVGSIGLSYCAMGGFDAYVNLRIAVKEWDVAAGRVVLEEAGGLYYISKGGAIIGGPKKLVKALSELIG